MEGVRSLYGPSSHKHRMQTGLRGPPAQKPIFTGSNSPTCQNRTRCGMTVKRNYTTEEPAVWPWPLQHTVRRDGDISRDKQHWQMSQFSGEIIRQAERWLSTQDCWAWTMSGPPGNGTSTVASAVLQSYRDHMFPTDDDRRYTAYVGFEEFEREAVLEGEIKAKGWVEKDTINREFLNDLAGKKMLILDDMCNRPMSKLCTDALHDLLRIREQMGSRSYKTIITTNRTIAELGQILGASVADRIAGGIILRFVDGSLRGQTNAKPLGVPVPEGDDLAKAATASMRAMEEYIKYGPGAFQRPRSFEMAPTAPKQDGWGNDTVESIAGTYWYRLCLWTHAEGRPLAMPIWKDLFWAVQTLAGTVGGLRNANQYIQQLMLVYWHQASSAVRQHAWTPDEAQPTNETIFLSRPVWEVMAPVVRGMTTAA